MILPKVHLRNDPGSETPAVKDDIGRTVVPLAAGKVDYDPTPDAETLRRFDERDRCGGNEGTSV